MLSRGFFDALAFWPTVAWPLIFSSTLYCFLRLCQMSRRRYGVSPLDQGDPRAPVFLYLFLPVAGLYEVAIHSYLLWTIGWPYLVMAVPIYIAGWILLPSLLEDFGPAQLLLPAAYLCFAAAFLVLLGFLDIDLLRQMNRQLYSLLTGLYISI
jgi:hypothetical protein